MVIDRYGRICIGNRAIGSLRSISDTLRSSNGLRGFAGFAGFAGRTATVQLPGMNPMTVDCDKAIEQFKAMSERCGPLFYENCKWCDIQYGPCSDLAVTKPQEAAQWYSDCRTPSPIGPPWTDFGAGGRNLPKESFFASLIRAARAPALWEYTPHNLFKISFMEPERVIGLAAWAMPLGVGIAVAPYLSPDPLTKMVLFPNAVASALADGKDWNWIGGNLLAPVVDMFGDQAEGGIAFLIGGTAGAAGVGIRQQARKLRRKFPTDPTMLTIAGIMDAIGDKALTLVDLLKNPASFRAHTTWNVFGDAVLAISNAIGGGVGGALRPIGEALNTFSISIAAAVSGDGRGALDNLTANIDIGGMRAPISGWKAEIRKYPDKAKMILSSIRADSKEVKFASVFSGMMGHIRSAIEQINLGGAFQSLVDSLRGIENTFAGALGGLQSLTNEARVAATGGALPPQPKPSLPSSPVPRAIARPVDLRLTRARPIGVRQTSPPLISKETVTGTRTDQPPPPPKPKPTAKGIGAPIAAGAGAGFLVGGPAGALLGAGGGLLVGLVRKPK